MSIFLERYALLKLTQEGRENMNRSKIKDLVSKENTYHKEMTKPKWHTELQGKTSNGDTEQ